jgi:hypothetical protein
MEKDNLAIKREMIFFGLEAVKLNPLPINAGIRYYDEAKVDDTRDVNKVKESILLKLPLNWMGKEYKNVYRPCIPAIQFVETFDDKPTNPSADFDIMQHPFIKVEGDLKEVNDNYIFAVQSGRRSGIAKCKDGRYYRFKGCGDLNMGFWLKPMDRPKNGREIRGCMFLNSSLCELHMSRRI